MGRPRKYDPDKVLDAAQEAFWRHGYEATSVADLCRVTGLEKGSLYHAFGDKRRLFFEVLARYLAEGRRGFEATVVDSPRLLDGLRNWLGGAADNCHVDGQDRGCFALNSLVELAPHDDEVASKLTSHFDQVVQLLVERIASAQIDGEVRSDRSPEQLAAFVLNALNGMTAAARGGQDRPNVVIDMVIESLLPRS